MSNEDLSFKRFILYVAPNKNDPNTLCSGSRKAMKLVEPIKEDVVIQSVQTMKDKKIEIPSFLIGTPTLVDQTDTVAYMGSRALEKLRSMAENGDSPTSLHDMSGPQADHMTDNDMNASDPFGEIQHVVEDEDDSGKVTEDMLQAYMKQRASTSTAPSQPPKI